MKPHQLIGLGCRLAVAGGRMALARLTLMTLALAICSGLLLVGLSIPAALSARADREAARIGIAVSRPPGNTEDYTLALGHRDLYGDKEVQRIILAGVGEAPVPPGLTGLPVPGEMIVSPALRALLQSPEGSLLRPRFPGRIADMIEPEGLLYPDELIGYIGEGASRLPGDDASVVVDYAAAPESKTYVSFTSRVLAILLVVVFLAPLGAFTYAASRLSAATREARWAAIRLAGGNQGQVRFLAAVETSLVAGMGFLVGLPVFLAFRRVVARGPFEDYRWFPDDLSLTAPAVLLLGLIVVIGSALMTVGSMRRLLISPLGVARRAASSHPGVLGPVVLGLGVVLLAAAAVTRYLLPTASRAALAILALAAILLLLGIIASTQWIGSVVARSLASRSGHPGILLGLRRIQTDPGSTGRAMAGLAVLILLAGVGQAIARSSAEDASGYLPNMLEDLPASSLLVTADPGGAATLRTLETVPGVLRLERRQTGIEGAAETAVYAVLVTDGRQETTEIVRNVLATRVARFVDVRSPSEIEASVYTSATRLAAVIRWLIVLAFTVTSAGVFVATIDGIMERRRSYAALSAIGAARRTLYAAVLAEVAVPLASGVALGVSLSVVVTTLLFWMLRVAIVIPFGFLAVAAVTALSAVGVIAGAVAPWIHTSIRPEMLRME